LNREIRGNTLGLFIFAACIVSCPSITLDLVLRPDCKRFLFFSPLRPVIMTPPGYTFVASDLVVVPKIPALPAERLLRATSV